MASRWVRITDQQEAIRLAKAGLLYWNYGDDNRYCRYSIGAFLVTSEWEDQLREWNPSVLVEEDEE